MLKKYKPAVKKESIEYSMEYLRDKTSGYSFPCDETGKVLNLTEEAEKNYRQCLTGKDYNGGALTASLRTHLSNWVEEAHGVCDCGRDVLLIGFTNTCECGKDYNRDGQLLADRSQWGEETGEWLGDILRI